MKPTKSPSTKSVDTRERIVIAALGLFESKGYNESTMRDIAKEAQVSLGLTYRYFSRKEELVLALYQKLAAQCVEKIQALGEGSIAMRYPAALELTLDTLSLHRSTLGALFSAGLSIDSSLAVLGDGTVDIREQMIDMYRQVITGSTDSPKANQVEQIAIIMYAGHLLTVLFWTQDRTEGQAQAKKLVRFYRKGIKWGLPFLRIAIVRKLLAELTEIIEPVFGARAATT